VLRLLPSAHRQGVRRCFLHVRPIPVSSRLRLDENRLSPSTSFGGQNISLPGVQYVLQLSLILFKGVVFLTFVESNSGLHSATRCFDWVLGVNGVFILRHMTSKGEELTYPCIMRAFEIGVFVLGGCVLSQIPVCILRSALHSGFGN